LRDVAQKMFVYRFEEPLIHYMFRENIHCVVVTDIVKQLISPLI